MIYSRAQDIDVRVAWGAGHGAIQVATLVKESPDCDPTQRTIDIINEWLVAAGEPMIDLAALRLKIVERATSENPASSPFFDGYHATLDDWASANALIRVLKRARDQAFGTPE